MYADKLGNNWAVVCQTCTRVFIYSEFPANKNDNTRTCPHCSDWTYHHDPVMPDVLFCNKEEQKAETMLQIDPDTMFDCWAETRELVQLPGDLMRYMYGDEAYIDIDASHSYRVIIGNSEEEFTSVLEAEKYLWNGHSKYGFDHQAVTGEV